jgi:hypothetical protein
MVVAMLRRGLRAIPVAVGAITYDPALDMTEAERATQRRAQEAEAAAEKAKTDLAEKDRELAEVKEAAREAAKVAQTELEAVKVELAAQARRSWL